MNVGGRLGAEFASMLWLVAEDLECDRAGVAVRGRRAAAEVTLMASDAVATEADQLQERRADGPAASPAWPVAEGAFEGSCCIGQAQGILMERFGIAAVEAFAVLVRQSHDTNVALRRVAESVVTKGHLESYGVVARD